MKKQGFFLKRCGVASFFIDCQQSGFLNKNGSLAFCGGAAALADPTTVWCRRRCFDELSSGCLLLLWAADFAVLFWDASGFLGTLKSGWQMRTFFDEFLSFLMKFPPFLCHGATCFPSEHKQANWWVFLPFVGRPHTQRKMPAKGILFNFGRHQNLNWGDGCRQTCYRLPGSTETIWEVLSFYWQYTSPVRQRERGTLGGRRWFLGRRSCH